MHIAVANAQALAAAIFIFSCFCFVYNAIKTILLLLCCVWWVRSQRSRNAIVPGIIRNGLVTSHNRYCWSPRATTSNGENHFNLTAWCDKVKWKEAKKLRKETKNVEIINGSVCAHNRRNYPFPASASAHIFFFVGFLQRFVVIAETMHSN